MRILLVSNSGWSPSGYGTQIQYLAPRLRDAGHDIAVSAFFGLQGGQITWQGIKHYPAGFKPYGNDVIHLHAQDFNADIVITLIDIWVLREDLHKLVRNVPWTPIDHEPVPEVVAARLKNAWDVMAYSKFAVQEMEKIGVSCHYVPHGVDTKVFRPMDDEDARKVRAKYNVPEDAFVVGMVAANQERMSPTRKGFDRILPAVANLIRKGYDDLYLYMHTVPTPHMGGMDLIGMIKTLGLNDRVYLPRPDVFPMGGLSREELAELYNMFDVYACPSTAEGFGIPLVEAQACGVPVIATRFTAMEELCSSGWFVEPITYFMTNMNAWRAMPDIQSIEDRISYAYDNRDEIKEKGEIAREFSKEYEWDTVVEDGWLPALEVMERRLNKQRESVQGPKTFMPRAKSPVAIKPKSD